MRIELRGIAAKDRNVAICNFQIDGNFIAGLCICPVGQMHRTQCPAHRHLAGRV